MKTIDAGVKWKPPEAHVFTAWASFVSSVFLRRCGLYHVAMDINTIANYGCVCGEGPIWHGTEKVLYWFDIPTGRLFRCDPRTGEHACVYTGRFIGAATVQRDDSLLLLGQDCSVLVYRDGKT